MLIKCSDGKVIKHTSCTKYPNNKEEWEKFKEEVRKFKMENITVSEMPLDFSWVGDYNISQEVVDTPDFRGFVRGSHSSLLKIPVAEVSDLNEFVKGFLMGVLHGQGLTIQEVKFQHSDLCNTEGKEIKPAYVHKVGDVYEIETWFVEKTI